MPSIEKGGIVRLNIMIDKMFFVSEAVVQALHTWLKQFPHEGPSNTVGENISLIMLQFMTFIIRLSDVNKSLIEAATYLLEGLTKCSVE